MSEHEMHSHWITASGSEGHEGNPQALFPYWSFTKTVIAICALKLVEDGLLELDAKLKDKPYTLRQLLAHTSGLPDYGQFSEYHDAVSAGEKPWPREKLLSISLANGMLFEPEQGWSYSNIGYMFVGEIMEEATDKQLRQIISEMICKPLGLESVTLAETQYQFSKLHWDAAATYDPRWVYHGCLIGNASDAAKFLHALFAGKLLKPETFDQMLVAKHLGGAIENRPWTKCGYALGLMSGEVGKTGRAIGHSGAGPFSVNAVYHYPDLPDPVTVACFSDGQQEGITEFAAEKLAEAKQS